MCYNNLIMERRDFLKGFAATAGSIPETVPAKIEQKTKKAVQEISAKSVLYCVFDNKGGILDGAYINNEKLPIASITKLLTAYVAYYLCGYYNIPLAKKVLITEEMKSKSKKSGSPTESSKIKHGQKFSIEELIKMLLINSSNTAAEALATNCGVGKSDFISAMNALSKHIGMKDSNFDSPSGLSPGNISTVNDIALLTRYVYFSKYKIGSLTDNHEGVTVNSGGVKLELRNANVILLERLRSKGVDVLLQKTGYIKESGKCITILFKKKGQIHCVVILNSEGGDDERRANVMRIIDSI